MCVNACSFLQAVAILKRTKGKVSLVVARKHSQPGSAPVPEKPTASISPRKETGSPRAPRRGPPVAKKPVRDSLSDPKKSGSPRKPESPQTTRKTVDNVPGGSPVSPRRQPMKLEVSELEVQVVQQSPRESAGTSYFLVFC